MPRLSLCPLTIIRATHRELVEAAAAGGFDAVGFRLIAPRPGDPVHPIEGGANGLDDLRKLMSDNGIALFDIEIPVAVAHYRAGDAPTGARDLRGARRQEPADCRQRSRARPNGGEFRGHLAPLAAEYPRSRVYRADLVVRGASSRSGEGPHPPRRRNERMASSSIRCTWTAPAKRLHQSRRSIRR